MILKYKNKFKSIQSSFDDIDLPDLAVFTGKNGSGKTHLLKGIKEDFFAIDDILPKEVLYLSYLDFAQNFQSKTNRGEREQLWGRFNNTNDQIGRIKIYDSTILGYKDVLEKVAIDKNIPIVEIKEPDLASKVSKEVATEIYSAIQSYKSQINTLAEDQQNVNDPLYQSVHSSVILKTQKLFSGLNESEFNSMFVKEVFGNSKILTDLSNVFFEYFINQERNEYNKRNGYSSLSDTEFVDKFGTPPWELIRNLFSGFGLHFDVNDPRADKIDPFGGSFGIIFRNKDRDNVIVNFGDLSSGEQILLTLINAIYTANKRDELPKLILLDEIDSPLNPSIIDKFVTYISDNFVSKGIKVIISTHSPSTVAFAPENSICLVNTTKTPPLSLTGKNFAISALTEGFITLTDLLQFERIKESKVIISEGKNYQYLKRAKDIFAPSDKDLTILTLNIGGTAQLRTLFAFMRGFNASKSFIFAFDCDYRYKEVRERNGALVKDLTGEQQYEKRDLTTLKSEANTTNKLFIFEEMKDSQSMRGIENLFNTDTTKTFPGEFDSKGPKNKASFEKFILNRNVTTDFVNFKELFEFIEKGSTEINF